MRKNTLQFTPHDTVAGVVQEKDGCVVIIYSKSAFVQNSTIQEI